MTKSNKTARRVLKFWSCPLSTITWHQHFCFGLLMLRDGVVPRKAGYRRGFQLAWLVNVCAGCYNPRKRTPIQRGRWCSQQIWYLLKWYYVEKIISFFLRILKAYSLNIQLAKFWALCFIRRLFILIVSFGFHGPPFLMFKTDR